MTIIKKEIGKITITNETTNKNTVEYIIAPCIKCGSDNIDFDEYEDQYGFISTAECKCRKNKVQKNCILVGVISEWNRLNDISKVIEANKQIIVECKNKISELKILKRQRASPNKINPTK